MNTRTSPLQKRDLAVFVLCAAFLTATLGAVGETGRRRAKETVCQANLRQWYGIFQGYIHENGGSFPSTFSPRGYYWLRGLDEKYKDRNRMQIWLCPQADTPALDETGSPSSTPSVFTAWGLYYGADYGPTGLAGSYGLNGYLILIPEWSSYEGGVAAADGWGNLDELSGREQIPMFIDALRFDLWPKAFEPPAVTEFASWTGNHMARCCINRHEGAVNCLFVDGSVRKVGLKELWTLKWHRSFDTTGPWTKAGGVQPEDWPAWIRPFKDY